MTSPASPEQPEDYDRQTDRYFQRDVDEFHREANVLAGHDPDGVSSDPPENLSARRFLVFAIIVLVGLVAAAGAVGLMTLPQCENPQYNWMPCIPDVWR